MTQVGLAAHAVDGELLRRQPVRRWKEQYGSNLIADIFVSADGWAGSDGRPGYYAC